MDLSTLFVQECDQTVFAYSFCVLRTFLRLVDVMVGSRITSILVVFPNVLSLFFIAYFSVPYIAIRCLLSPFSTISRRFIIGACVGDDIIDFSDLLDALATLDALCWIMSVMRGFALGVDVVTSNVDLFVAHHLVFSTSISP